MCFLVFKYEHFPKQKKTLENSWTEIESLALNRKRVDLFKLWIKKQKDVLYVKSTLLT